MRFPWTRDWQLVDKTVLPSPMEQMLERGGSLKSAEGHGLFTTTVVLSYKCMLTGRTKTVKVSSG